MLCKNDLDDIFMLYFAQWFQSEHSLYFSLYVMRLRKHKCLQLDLALLYIRIEIICFI